MAQEDIKDDYKFNANMYTGDVIKDKYYIGFHIQSLYLYKMFVRKEREFKDITQDDILEINHLDTNLISHFICKLMKYIGAYTTSTFGQIIQGDEKILSKYTYTSMFFNGTTNHVLSLMKDEYVFKYFDKNDCDGNRNITRRYFDNIEKKLLSEVQHLFSLLLKLKKEKHVDIIRDERIIFLCQQLHVIDPKIYTIDMINSFLLQLIKYKLCYINCNESVTSSCMTPYLCTNNESLCPPHTKMMINKIVKPMFDKIGLRDLVSIVVSYM